MSILPLYIFSSSSEPIRKTGGGFKGKVISLFKTNTHEDYSKQTVSRKKPRKFKVQEQSEDKIIKNIRNLRLEKLYN